MTVSNFTIGSLNPTPSTGGLPSIVNKTKQLHIFAMIYFRT